MQVFAVFVVGLASVAAKGSGPYLPSGWRPDGPAFYLPSEVQKPAESPLQDVILAGSEASGSDALREYGPPKVELPSPVINQGLPDVAIEQNFIEAVFSSDGDKVSSIVLEKVVEEAAEKSGISLEQSEVATESANVESQASLEEKLAITAAVEEAQAIVEEISERSINSGISAEINAEEEQTEGATTELAQEISQEVIIVQEISPEEKQEVLSTESIQEEVQESTTSDLDVRSEIVQKIEEVSNLEQITQTVPEILANLESSFKSDIDITQAAVESSQETSGSSEKLPEGFLEYGPPGFKEYGPPKEDLNVVAIQSLLSQASIDTNEARRRRFSPKFKPAKKQNRKEKAH